MLSTLNSLKKRLRGHPNIVQFYSAASLSEKETEHGMSEYLILTELCSGKNIFVPFCKQQKYSVTEKESIKKWFH